MKTCQQCGAEDNPIVSAAGGEDPTITHFVRPEIQYLKPDRELTPREIAQGWTKRIFQGRPAIERNICMNCLNGNYIRKQLTAEQKRKARALEQEQSGDSNFFLLLADVDGAY